MKPFTEQEISVARSATKGTTECIHLNNAGASLQPEMVIKAMVDYMHEEALYGGYETEAKYENQLHYTNVLIAQLINANADEIALTENASAAWEIAFNGLQFQRGDEIITSEMEYASNILALLNAQQLYGIKIKVIANDAQGNFPISELEAAITPETKLIAVTHVGSTAGNVLPVASIGEIARKHHVNYLIDAAQSVGQMPVDVQAIGCDLLIATGRKFLRGPRGTGFLFVRKQIQDKLKLLFFDGRTITSMDEQSFAVRKDASRFQWHEKNPAVVMGLQKAVEYALETGVERIWERIKFLSLMLRQKLRGIDGITVYDQGDELCGIVTFSLAGKPNAEVKTKLAAKNINVTVGPAKNTLYYMNRRGLDSILRASVHYYNTENELEKLCSELRML